MENMYDYMKMSDDVQLNSDYYKSDNTHYYKLNRNESILHIDKQHKAINELPLPVFKTALHLYNNLEESDSEEFDFVLKEIIMEMGIWQYVENKNT